LWFSLLHDTEHDNKLPSNWRSATSREPRLERVMSGALRTYRSKRNFAATPEPQGKQTRAKASKPLRYLIQRHAATRLHYDFRIEYHGVLKSWAVTKAPSRDPIVKRLAVEVEDHPIDYGSFEGTIPKGGYGAGTVQLWDRGHWTPQDADFDEALKAGVIKIELDGERLKGGWALVRLKSDRGRPSKSNNWLLIKEKDAHAIAGEGDALAEIDASVTTGRSLAEIAQGKRQSIASKPPHLKASAKLPPGTATKQTRTKPPVFVPVQLCKIAAHPPDAVGWAHEIKFDGYRIEVGVGGDRAALRTRKGRDWSDRFRELSAEAAVWPDAVLDGELCALDADHRPDFSALQAAISDKKTCGLIYFAFDLLSAKPLEP
jgi:bifunctional non-homologous end joining protein LigD